MQVKQTSPIAPVKSLKTEKEKGSNKNSYQKKIKKKSLLVDNRSFDNKEELEEIAHELIARFYEKQHASE